MNCRIIERRTLLRPRNALLVWDDPDYVEDVTVDPVGRAMFWIYFDDRGGIHNGRCITPESAKQWAAVYGYREPKETPVAA